MNSVSQCPPVMRVVFKQLHKRVEEQFPEPENEVRTSSEPHSDDDEGVTGVILTVSLL